MPGGTPEPGDKIMCEDAGAKQIDPGLDTHEAYPAVDKPATDMDIKVNLTQMARQSAIAHTPTLRRSIATRAAKKHRFRSKSRDWWKKIATEDQSTRCSRLQWRRAWRKWMKSLRVTDEGASKEETFNVLADAYTLSDEVRDLFLKGPMENLQDFRYYFAEEEEIETFVAATLGTRFSATVAAVILDSNQWRNKDSYQQLWDQIGKVTDAWTTVRRICRRNENHIVGAATRNAMNVMLSTSLSA